MRRHTHPSHRLVARWYDTNLAGAGVFFFIWDPMDLTVLLPTLGFGSGAVGILTQYGHVIIDGAVVAGYPVWPDDQISRIYVPL